MPRRATAVVVLSLLAAALTPWPGNAASRQVTQTLVFDAVGRGSFVDQPPAGPSPGDTEHFTARLRDATGRSSGPPAALASSPR